MEYKQIQCREHGGMFSVPVRRGRPPVKCSDDNVCDAARKRKQSPAAAARAVIAKNANPRNNGGRRPATAANARSTKRQVSMEEQVTETRRAAKNSHNRFKPVPTAATPAVVTNNPSIPLAHAAKRALEPHGWKCEGRGWVDTEGKYASVVATRGEETISLLWTDGKLTSQDYSLWDSDKPKSNSQPKSRLNFIPDEMTDRALVKELTGRKLTWWNKIGKSADSDRIRPESKITVSHVFTGVGSDEDLDDRQITFVGETGFRTIRVSQLLKVS